ncbi:MAG TPA: hypothetical protein VGO93_06090 [Candidatus Xenobia bacterium]|jgi:hypothetical protein
MPDTLYGTFPNPMMAERAVGALLDHGASVQCISVLGIGSPSTGITTTTGGDAAAGAMKGAGIGLGVGALAAVACLIIPGFGLVIGGGALALALGAAAATTAAGAIAGGVAGYLIDQGVPDKVAVSYQEELAAGRSLLAVSIPCGELHRSDIELLLDKYGAANVSTHAQPGVQAIEQPIPMDVVAQVPSAVRISRQDAFVQHFQDNYRDRGFTYSEVGPAYEFGYLRGQEGRFTGRSWDMISYDVRAEWEEIHPGTADAMVMAMRYGFERARSRLITSRP